MDSDTGGSVRVAQVLRLCGAFALLFGVLNRSREDCSNNIETRTPCFLASQCGRKVWDHPCSHFLQAGYVDSGIGVLSYSNLRLPIFAIPGLRRHSSPTTPRFLGRGTDW